MRSAKPHHAKVLCKHCGTFHEDYSRHYIRSHQNIEIVKNIKSVENKRASMSNLNVYRCPINGCGILVEAHDCESHFSGLHSEKNWMSQKRSNHSNKFNFNMCNQHREPSTMQKDCEHLELDVPVVNLDNCPDENSNYFQNDDESVNDSSCICFFHVLTAYLQWFAYG